MYIDGYREKCVMITGCDSGFGNELAKRLDRLGLRVIAGCYTEQGIQELHNACSGRFAALRLDITDAASVEEALNNIKRILREGNRVLWGLLNNAGVFGDLGPVEWSSKEDFSKVFEVNVYGSIRMTRAFLPLLKLSRLQREARIHDQHNRTHGFFALEAFGDACRRSLRPFGVSVHMIEPGSCVTGLNFKADAAKLKEASSGTWKRLHDEVIVEYGRDYYDKWCQRFINNYFMMASSNLRSVTSSMENALLSRHPRGRYPVGVDANFFVLPLQKLPEWITDSILMNSFSGPPPPASVKA
ncbi:hypothetical protein CAPTEDRAFT_200586 [Capitella teleta]|uniref:Uncharacterized protein n=1 Tax=Capitella teleta TaxID=283909 RepID=R7TEJ2_CAPTE|nr:hypothetical protein CAPTEDRAFT_200586 [Capitella teleta]|eukprot:ELT89892.1 hypothetical protein CAPTEDRAFT_200586 [Capitella teleta]